MSLDAGELLRRYLDAGRRMDVDEFDRIYAPDFTNVRIDLAGHVFQLARAELMAALRERAAQGLVMPPSDDVEVLATTQLSGQATIMFRRVKHGRPIIYTFIWDTSTNPAVLRQEITTQTQLPTQMICTASDSHHRH
jgi:hypothetical protein